jgi:hypothetical protein
MLRNLDFPKRQAYPVTLVPLMLHSSLYDMVFVIAQVVGWENPDPTMEQVLQLGNPTPNVTSM